MNKKYKDIFLLLAICSIIGVARSLILNDIPIIKLPIKEISHEEIKNIKDLTLDGPKVVRLNECKEMYDNMKTVFIDARDTESFSEGHILGAINIFFENSDDDLILEKLDGVSNDQIIVVYCDGGECDLSEELGNHLFNNLSYKNILLYEGGFPEWKEGGLPIEGSTQNNIENE